MGFVPRVDHRTTGERVEHVEYDRLFQAIKRRVRRSAVAPWRLPLSPSSGATALREFRQ